MSFIVFDFIECLRICREMWPAECHGMSPFAQRWDEGRGSMGFAHKATQ